MRVAPENLKVGDTVYILLRKRNFPVMGTVKKITATRQISCTYKDGENEVTIRFNKNGNEITASDFYSFLVSKERFQDAMNQAFIKRERLKLQKLGSELLNWINDKEKLFSLIDQFRLQAEV